MSGDLVELVAVSRHYPGGVTALSVGYQVDS